MTTASPRWPAMVRALASARIRLDARYAAARGFVDALVFPEATREILSFLLEITGEFSGPHLGAFILPYAP